MTRYSLRNGIVIDDVQWGPFSLNTGVGTRLVDVFDADKLNKAKIFWKTGEPQKEAGIAVKVKTLIRNATEDLLSNNTMALLQTVKIDHQTFFYAGQNEQDCGSSEIAFQNKLLTRILDCTTDDRATTAPTFPFYRTPVGVTSAIDKGFETSFDDSPGESMNLYVLNPLVGDIDSRTSKPAGKWNFLKQGRSTAAFMIILAFVHQDNSFQLIEGWGWSIQRDFDMTWTKSRPLVTREAAIMIIDSAATPAVRDQHRRAYHGSVGRQYPRQPGPDASIDRPEHPRDAVGRQYGLRSQVLHAVATPVEPSPSTTGGERRS